MEHDKLILSAVPLILISANQETKQKPSTVSFRKPNILNKLFIS